MTWLASSFMGRRGVAQAQERAHHSLTETDQGAFHYVYGPYAKPVMHVAPGDVVAVETLDAFGGAVKTEADLPSKVLNMPFVNGHNGADPRFRRACRLQPDASERADCRARQEDGRYARWRQILG